MVTILVLFVIFGISISGFIRSYILWFFPIVAMILGIAWLSDVLEVFFANIGIDKPGKLFSNLLIIPFFPAFWDLIIGVFAGQYGKKIFLSFLTIILLWVVYFPIITKYETWFDKHRNLSGILMITVGINTLFLFGKGLVYWLIIIDFISI